MSGILIAICIWAIGFMIWVAILVYIEVATGPTNVFRQTLALVIIWPLALTVLIIKAASELFDRVVPR